MLCVRAPTCGWRLLPTACGCPVCAAGHRRSCTAIHSPAVYKTTSDAAFTRGRNSAPCRYKLTVHLFKPKSRSGLLSFMSWIKRKPPQFLHSDFVCESEGREGTLRHRCSYLSR